MTAIAAEITAAETNGFGDGVDAAYAICGGYAKPRNTTERDTLIRRTRAARRAAGRSDSPATIAYFDAYVRGMRLSLI